MVPILYFIQVCYGLQFVHGGWRRLRASIWGHWVGGCYENLVRNQAPKLFTDCFCHQRLKAKYRLRIFTLYFSSWFFWLNLLVIRESCNIFAALSINNFWKFLLIFLSCITFTWQTFASYELQLSRLLPLKLLLCIIKSNFIFILLTPKGLLWVDVTFWQYTKIILVELN